VTTISTTRSRRTTRRHALARLAAPLVACAAWSHPVQAKTPGEVEVGAMLRDATMQGLNGPPKRLSDFRGRPLIINVWASWCGPCRAEMASLERLAWSEHAGKFAVIGISTDDYPDKARALLTQTNATLSHFIDQKLLLENMLGADRLPLTVLVDAQGKVLEKVVGAKQWDGPEAVQLIARVFKGQPTGQKAAPPAKR
jgi:thiol-disulfide isomerase/thioredoxin